MRILIVGGGGREHALAWALRSSDLITAPGNAGTAEFGCNVEVAPHDIENLVAVARERHVDLAVVGSEVPLVCGIEEAFRASGIPLVGPSSAAARLEGSKAFAKVFMTRNGVPTADYSVFDSDSFDKALAYLRECEPPVVIKASGLAFGKGVMVCQTTQEAEAALDHVMRAKAFGSAGQEVVIESFLEGEEASVFALIDGDDYVLLPTAQDHKRIGEGDTGPNTGGMGAYAPAPVVTCEALDRICHTIIEPTLEGMAREGNPYQGFLYAGLMMTAVGPKVVEFNCRLGDPEAQVVLPMLDADFEETLWRAAEGSLGNYRLSHKKGAAACVVMASGGYPGSYEKGFPITGLKEAASLSNTVVFHAGTSMDAGGATVTSGGRVLGVTATGIGLREALHRAYAAVDQIHFKQAYYRRDIGVRGLAHLEV